MSERPVVIAEVTFLRNEEGGRKSTPTLNVGKYMPHIVVQNPEVREAVVDDDRVCRELYQGIRFMDGPTDYRLGEAVLVELDLMYFPDHGYDNVIPGATFTIREGWKIVGFGRVRSRSEPTRGSA